MENIFTALRTDRRERELARKVQQETGKNLVWKEPAFLECPKCNRRATRAHWAELLKRQPGDTSDAGQLTRLIEESVRIKERIVSQDPYEKGLRKALNLGHTVGHAFESFTFHTDHPALHGYAVAWGLVCELYLSARLTGFPTEALHQTTRFIHEHWGHLTFSCDDYPALYSLMLHDKKNTGGTINFTLLRDIGDIALNQTAGRDLIYEALDYYRETCE